MDFKNILSTLSQLSEAQVRKVTGRAYGAGEEPTDDDDEDEDGKKKAEPQVKRGRGRPRKGSDETGQVKKYEFGPLSKAMGVATKAPQLSKKDKKSVTKHSLKEWVEEIEEKYVAEAGLTPTQTLVPGLQAGGNTAQPTVIDIKNNPALKAALDKAAKDKQITAVGIPQPAAGSTGQAPTAQGATPMKEEDYSAKKASAGKDIGKPGKQFSKIAKSAGKRYGSKAAGERVAGAVLAKLRSKTNEGVEQGMAEGSEYDIGDLDELIDSVDSNLSRRQDPARYEKVKVDKKAKIIYWITQETTSKQSEEFAIRLAKILKNKGFNGWTVKVVRIDFYNGKRSPWKVAIAGAQQGMAEGDIPSQSGVDTSGANLSVGRSDTTLESKKAKPDFLDIDKDGNKKESMKKAAQDKKKKKKVDESMNTLEAAYHEGKSHGLSKHNYACRYDEGTDEHHQYHKGFKEGLDECYGMHNEPIIGMEEDMAMTVPGMADQTMLSAISETEFDDAMAGLQKTVDFAEKHGYKMKRSPAGKVITFVNKAINHTLVARVDKDGDSINVNFMDYTSGESGNDDASYFHNTFKRLYNEALIEHQESLDTSYASDDELFDRSGGGVDDPGYPYNAKIDEFAFENWDRELNDLLNEGQAPTFNVIDIKTGKSVGTFRDGAGYMPGPEAQRMSYKAGPTVPNGCKVDYKSKVNEGMSVSISKGQQGAPDSVTVSAQDAEADALLGLIKHAGLGLFGDEAGHIGAGADDSMLQKQGGIDVVGDHDGMMALIKKVAGADDQDYEDEEGSEQTQGMEEPHHHDHEHTDEETCNECGYMESECQCDKEPVDEVDSYDQKAYEVAEDNAPDSGAEETEAEDEEISADNAADAHSGGATDEELDESKCSDCGKDPCECDHEDVEESVHLDEWANQIGKGDGKGTDAQFEQDIEFMTRVISGGLNKPKSTGQTTVPVIAGQNTRMEDPRAWAVLAGIKK